MHHDFRAGVCAFEIVRQCGNGLKFVRENIEKRKMRLHFISDGFQADINKKFEVRALKKRTKGCLAIIEI